MQFRTQFDRVRTTTNSGPRFNPTHKLQYDENGVACLVQVGKVDTYEYIQSWRDSCDIKVILERFQNGDVTALQRQTPLYGDFTQAPQTLAEHLQLLRDAEESFRNLPLDIRSQFNHNPAEFYASIGSDRFNTIMGLNNVPSNGTVEKNVPSNGTVEKNVPSNGTVKKEVVNSEPQPE